MEIAIAGLGLTLALSIISGIVWAIRQEGRLNAHDALFKERDTQGTERHTDLKLRLTRIEEKLDSARDTALATATAAATAAAIASIRAIHDQKP